MAWLKEGAVPREINATSKVEASSAQSRLPQSLGLVHCTECGAEILKARREAIPSARLCVVCQEAQDRDIAHFYKWRGSKDSQQR
jgi:RNA polymerase-binding transcription factor DksA